MTPERGSVTPIEALQYDPEAQLAERHRQETPWLDHMELRPGDLVSFERWTVSSGGEPGILQFNWFALHTGLLVSWQRTPSNRTSEFRVLLPDGLSTLQLYDSEADRMRARLLQRRQLS